MVELEKKTTCRVRDLMENRAVSLEQLVERSGLDRQVVAAIADQRYTPSPRQREVVAGLLSTDSQRIWWGHAAKVEPLKEPI